MPALHFLFDENIPRALGAVAREEGFDAAFIVDLEQGISDAGALARAAQDHQIVVTEDTDFGRLVFADSLRVPGVVLIRIPPWKRLARAQRFRWLLQQEAHRLSGNFVVLSEHALRLRSIAGE
ncbi:MAG: DUF5615 family PIN-like protein [Rhizomicrobium sp.]